MRIHRVLYPSLGIVVPRLALADVSVSNAALGQVEGILKFCSQVNPQVAKNAQAQSALLIGKASARDQVDARNADEYKAAREAISAELVKLEKKHAVEVCSTMAIGQ